MGSIVPKVYEPIRMQTAVVGPTLLHRVSSTVGLRERFDVLRQLTRTDSFIMFLSVLLVMMMMVRWTDAGYTGTVLSHTSKDVQGNSVTALHRFKFGYSSCGEAESWICSGCSKKIDERSGQWCLREHTWWGSRSFYNTYYGWNTGTWINNRNGVSSGVAVIFVEERKRSDINKPNSSPQTGILPVMRVPSNCQININLLTFDPDGDHVQCRHGSNPSNYECYTCTPPSVLSLSSPCSLSFSPTNSSDEGSYAVQLMMEDFPSQTITLTYYNGSTVSISNSSSMSRIPVQFVFKVDPAAPSCTAGEYLPRFLPPTPEHGAQFFINVNETIEINITAEATQSVITELLFSGPFNMTKSSSGSGNFTLRWTPSVSQHDDNESHPICFVVQANASSSIYQSELRCVIVTVRNLPFIAIPSPPTTSVTSTTVALPLTTTSPPPKTSYVVVLKLKISTTLSLKDNKDEIEKAIKDELISEGLPPDIKVRLLSDGSVKN
ncbi:uncharacterized protein LOC114157948 isoform X6 [Xiphophorus couchianus]|uniref:uncharacterized protein LOC114157948 isoform X6 n=1 Tax=Xiphophorus couchianus TaxID=32473 RepID=UPI001016BB33|nr:uncharacterized protein LOC114157948 isoform X6 [Xiphophorus couchianus]